MLVWLTRELDSDLIHVWRDEPTRLNRHEFGFTARGSMFCLKIEDMRDMKEVGVLWPGEMKSVQLTMSEVVSVEPDEDGCMAVLGDSICGVDLSRDDIPKSCDKKFRTCRDVFRNESRFVGFPKRPG